MRILLALIIMCATGMAQAVRPILNGQLQSSLDGNSQDITGVATLSATTVNSGALAITGNVTLGDATTDTVTIGGSAIMLGEAANILALRNSTNAQGIRLYNTYTNGSNYERLDAGWVGNRFDILTGRAGAGSNRELGFGTAGSMDWYIDTNGHFLPVSSTARNIGSTANRIQSVVTSGVNALTIALPDNAAITDVDTAQNFLRFQSVATISDTDLWVEISNGIRFGAAPIISVDGGVSVTDVPLSIHSKGTGVLTLGGTGSAVVVNKVTITAPATGSTLTIADGKTLTASNSLTLAGTDGSTVTFGAGGTVAYTSNNLSAFAATTSAQLLGVLSDETGSGLAVFATSPSLITPTLGVATATTINGLTITATGTKTLTIANGKTLTASNSITLAGTDGSTITFGTGGTVVYTANTLGVFAATTSAQLSGVLSDETGTGAIVLGTSPVLTTPALTSPVISGSPIFDVSSGSTGLDGSNWIWLNYDLDLAFVEWDFDENSAGEKFTFKSGAGGGGGPLGSSYGNKISSSSGGGDADLILNATGDVVLDSDNGSVVSLDSVYFPSGENFISGLSVDNLYTGNSSGLHIYDMFYAVTAVGETGDMLTVTSFGQQWTTQRKFPLFDLTNYPDAGGGGMESNLSSFEIPVRNIQPSYTNQDPKVFEYECGGSIVASVGTKRLRAYFAGAEIYDSGALATPMGSDFILRVKILVADNSTVKTTVELVTSDGALGFRKCTVMTHPTMDLGTDGTTVIISSECTTAGDVSITYQTGINP